MPGKFIAIENQTKSPALYDTPKKMRTHLRITKSNVVAKFDSSSARLFRKKNTRPGNLSY